MHSLVQGSARAPACHAKTGLGGFQAEKRDTIEAKRAFSESRRTLPGEWPRRNCPRLWARRRRGLKIRKPNNLRGLNSGGGSGTLCQYCPNALESKVSPPLRP